MTSAPTSQAALFATYKQPPSTFGSAPQLALFASYTPQAAKYADVAQGAVLIACSGGLTNVTAEVSQGAIFIAYKEGIPDQSRQDTWTFVLDGHRMWVLPLGPEGDWAYDQITKQWCHLETQGFGGQLNFTHGVMWGLRIVGGDQLYGVLYELDPNAAADEGWRPIEHYVTGGLAVRSPTMIGCANFRLTASAGVLLSDTTDLELSFSDDNGKSWIGPFVMALAEGDYGQQLVYSGLGSFSAPGRIFSVYDSGGLVRIDGADAALNNYDEDQAPGS
jgi:hypothetical protein